jgi:hypothetical protein
MRFLKSHVRYIIVFKGNEQFKFYYCGSNPIVNGNNLKVENVNIKVNKDFKIAVSLLNLNCDCSSQYLLRQVDEAQWQDLNATPRHQGYNSPEIVPKMIKSLIYPTLDTNFPKLPKGNFESNNFIDQDKQFELTNMAKDQKEDDVNLQIKDENHPLLVPNDSLPRLKKSAPRSIVQFPY